MPDGIYASVQPVQPSILHPAAHRSFAYTGAPQLGNRHNPMLLFRNLGDATIRRVVFQVHTT
jgi:hypothetical protein